MNFIDEFNGEAIIICNHSSKKAILCLNKLKPIKFFTINEFIRKYCFDYDENAILYLMNKYLYKYDVAKKYIDNLYYIDDIDYDNSKLSFLVKIYRELKENNLLIFNDNFKEYAKRVKIFIYGVYVSNNFLNKINELDYQIIDIKYNNYTHDVYELETMEDEVYYVCSLICNLIHNGVSPRKIKLTNVTNEYYDTIERIFSLHNLKVNIDFKTSLASYEVVRKFISLYRNNDLDYALNMIDKDDIIYPEIVRVINKSIKYNDKELLIYNLEHTYLKSIKYDNGIDIVSYFDYVSNDFEYVFMLGFNEENIPIKKNDTQYITDDICSFVLLDDSNKINDYNRNLTLNIIRNIKNLVITYKNRDYKNIYYPSSLCEYFNVVKKEISYDISYSPVYFKNILVKMYDDYFKYGLKNKYFDEVNNSFKIKYNSYSNKYHFINREMDKLNLSYTKLNLYNKCAFSYYLTDILKLSIYEENFSATIGSMIHYVLYKTLSLNDMDIQKYVYEFLQDKVLDKKEEFFLNKYIESIQGLIDEIILEREYSLFNQALYEKKIDIDYGNGVTFSGIIDKVLYYQDKDVTYVSLIDYKTGNDDINLKYLKYGIDIQLPIYLYLSTKLGFSNMRYTGFYLQKFNIKDMDFRLEGYSNSDTSVLTIQDNNYSNSKIIKGLKTLKDGGFSKKSKIVSDDDINRILDEAKNQINIVIDKIRNNSFEINPKVIDEKNISCKYCKFKDICFKDSSDEVILELEDTDGVY